LFSFSDKLNCLPLTSKQEARKKKCAAKRYLKKIFDEVLDSVIFCVIVCAIRTLNSRFNYISIFSPDFQNNLRNVTRIIWLKRVVTSGANCDPSAVMFCAGTD